MWVFEAFQDSFRWMCSEKYMLRIEHFMKGLGVGRKVWSMKCLSDANIL